MPSSSDSLSLVLYLTSHAFPRLFYFDADSGVLLDARKRLNEQLNFWPPQRQRRQQSQHARIVGKACYDLLLEQSLLVWLRISIHELDSDQVTEASYFFDCLKPAKLSEQVGGVRADILE